MKAKRFRDLEMRFRVVFVSGRLTDSVKSKLTRRPYLHTSFVDLEHVPAEDVRVPFLSAERAKINAWRRAQVANKKQEDFKVRRKYYDIYGIQ